MNTPDTALRGQNTAAAGRLYLTFELGEKNWKLSPGDGQRAPSHYMVIAGDITAVLTSIANAKVCCHRGAAAPISCCYEVGSTSGKLDALPPSGRLARPASIILPDLTQAPSLPADPVRH